MPPIRLDLPLLHKTTLCPCCTRDGPLLVTGPELAQVDSLRFFAPITRADVPGFQLVRHIRQLHLGQGVADEATLVALAEVGFPLLWLLSISPWPYDSWRIFDGFDAAERLAVMTNRPLVEADCQTFTRLSLVLTSAGALVDVRAAWGLTTLGVAATAAAPVAVALHTGIERLVLGALGPLAGAPAPLPAAPLDLAAFSGGAGVTRVESFVPLTASGPGPVFPAVTCLSCTQMADYRVLARHFPNVQRLLLVDPPPSGLADYLARLPYLESVLVEGARSSWPAGLAATLRAANPGVMLSLMADAGQPVAENDVIAITDPIC